MAEKVTEADSSKNKDLTKESDSDRNKNLSDIDVEKIKERKRIESIVLRVSASNNFRTGVGMNYVVPFALAMGANNIQVGLLSSLPALLGNSVQLLTHKF